MASVVQKNLPPQNEGGQDTATTSSNNADSQTENSLSHFDKLYSEPNSATNSHLESILEKINNLMTEAKPQNSGAMNVSGGDGQFVQNDLARGDQLGMTEAHASSFDGNESSFQLDDAKLSLQQPYTSAMNEVRDYFNDRAILNETDQLLQPGQNGEMISTSPELGKEQMLNRQPNIQSESAGDSLPSNTENPFSFTPMNFEADIERSSRSFEVLKPEDMSGQQFQREIVNRMSQLEQVIGYHYGDSKNLAKEAAQAAVKLTLENLDQTSLGRRVGEMESLLNQLQNFHAQKDMQTQETLKKFSEVLQRFAVPPALPQTDGSAVDKVRSPMVEKQEERVAGSTEDVPKFLQEEEMSLGSLSEMSALTTMSPDVTPAADKSKPQPVHKNQEKPGGAVATNQDKVEGGDISIVDRLEKEIVAKSSDLRSQINNVTMVVSDDGVHNMERKGARPAIVITVVALLIATGGLMANNHSSSLKAFFSKIMSSTEIKNQAKLGKNKEKTIGLSKEVKTPEIVLRGQKEIKADGALVTGNISRGKLGEAEHKEGKGQKVLLNDQSVDKAKNNAGKDELAEKFNKNPEMLLPSSQGRLSLPPALIGPYSLRYSAANGDAAAQYEVARRFATGKGVKRDYDEAVKWYMYASAQGLAPAQYRLATLYERGRGVEKNIQRAKIWYERAAELGNIKAMHNLAVISAALNKKRPDYLTAIYWFKEAARRNLADSQFNLAILYQNGVGLKQNLVEAYKWFSLAARQGDLDAAKRRDLLEKQLKKVELVQAHNMLQKWKPDKVNIKANVVGLNGRHVTSTLSHAKETVTRSRVLTAQILLRKLGYKLDDIDGKLTENTAKTIKQFEKDKGLPITGKVTRDLIKILNKAAI